MPIVPFRWHRPWTNVGQVGACTLVHDFGSVHAVALTCSSRAQASCQMKRPIGPLGCQVISRFAPTELVTGQWSPTRARSITRQAGAAGRNRTCDPLLRREMLYPLSYSRQRASVSRVRGQAGCGIERSADCRSSRNCTSFGHAGARSTGAAVLYSQSYDVANGGDAATPFYLESGRRQTWVRNSRWQACWPSARSPVH